MAIASPPPLHEQTYSLEHDRWIDLLATTENLLIIQDLDGVCMGLVKDPLNRVIHTDYVEATKAFDGHFYVLTNGEHVGQRGVNGIIERAFGDADGVIDSRGYLPGLAAGGVQWQTRTGAMEHPGVSDAELQFLSAVPDKIRQRIRRFFEPYPGVLSAADLTLAIAASALDNMASPTANLNTCHSLLQENMATYVALQHDMQRFMEDLLTEAKQQSLGDSFFVHYAPNHGRGPDGKEVVWFSQGQESGTTDFQLMLRGAIKEAGVLALLNRYYGQRTGTYPLGKDWSVRQAPHRHWELIELVTQHFDPAAMPSIIGVGDTVTSTVLIENGQAVAKRGGSDRNFLHLVQDIGRQLGTGNVVTYVDSSGGELKNRKALTIKHHNGQPVVIEGPGDARDTADPLTLNVVFPGGYQQYCQAFQTAAKRRQI